MEIGIIGAGNIGITLGKQWLKIGHIVYFGVRDASLSSRWDELLRNVISDYKVVLVVQAVQSA